MADKQDFTRECLQDCRQSTNPLVNQVKEVPHLRDRYCNHCRNKTCQWALLSEDLFEKRVKTQEDRFINTPNFADESHPRFFEVRAIDFPDLMREAIILEAADRRQDWEIPSIQESVDIVLSGLSSNAIRTKQVDEAVRALAEARGSTLPELPKPERDQKEEVGKLQEEEIYKISVPSSSSKEIYEVSLDTTGKALSCTCKAGSFGKTCRHLRDAERMLQANPDFLKHNKEILHAQEVAPPESIKTTGGKRQSLFPSSYKINTPVSSEGIYIGGNSQTSVSMVPTEKDPWEPTREEFVEVGSTITIVTKK